MKGQKSRMFQFTVVGGVLLCLWSSAAILSGLAQVNWQVSELLRQYMTAIGVIKEFHTFVDFYTHVKGIEYLIAVAFLVAFPLYYRSLDRKSVEDEGI